MLSETSDVHKSTRPNEIKHSEADINNIITAISQFINPFTVENDRKNSLFCLSSGKPADAKVEDHLLHYTDIGATAPKDLSNVALLKKVKISMIR